MREDPLTGAIQIDKKPGMWLSLDDKRIRPKKDAEGALPTPRATPTGRLAVVSEKDSDAESGNGDLEQPEACGSSLPQSAELVGHGQDRVRTPTSQHDGAAVLSRPERMQAFAEAVAHYADLYGVAGTFTPSPVAAADGSTDSDSTYERSSAGEEWSTQPH